jgi:pimeloyl-ACP methyl ester carboxylesterase
MLTEDHWIELPNRRLFARSWTKPAWRRRPTILLVHDSLGCVELWRDYPERLARRTGHPVVAYDRHGFGRSDAHPGPLPEGFMQAEAAETIPALREQLGLDAIVPYGYSVGGAMAVATAARMPDACRAVVTVSAQAFVEDRTVAGIRQAQDAFRDPHQFARLVRHHGDKARWVLDAWTDTWLAPGFASWCLDDELKRVRCPLLAIHGERHEYGSPRHPERIAALVSGPSEVAILEHAGHMIHRDSPDELIHAVAGFLAARAV